MAGVAGPEALRRLVDATVSIGADLDLRSVLQRVLDAAVDLSDATYGALGVLDESGKGFVDLLTVGFSDEQIAAIGPMPQGLGLLGHVIATKQPVRVPVLGEHPNSVGFPPNHPPMQSFLGVPIRVRDRVFGNLYLTDKHSGEVFTDVDEELVVKLAVAAGIAIEHARLFEAVAYRERVIATFNAVSAALLMGQPRDDVLQMVAASARELLHCALASIVLTDEQGVVYVPAADGRLTEAYRGKVIPSGTIAKRLLRTRTAGSIENLGADPEFGELVGDLGGVLYVPIVGDEPGAWLVACRIAGEPPFLPADLALLETLATRAGLVLEHDRFRKREAELARTDDQFRIAEQLQDSALQEIFSASLLLSATVGIAEKQEVRERINEAIEILDRAVTLTRQAIFDLNPRP